MYSYTWDSETGGLLLNSSPLQFSKEPRPVYYQELDILGFDRFWNYAKDDSAPYMWAEANNYYYRGKMVAQTKGGASFIAPQIELLELPEPEGKPLKLVDLELMASKNWQLIEARAQETIKDIYNFYLKKKDNVDVFYVAFSGGKDSVLALDLVQRALPHSDFKVLFGDTGMEFPDTYSLIEHIKRYCSSEGIDFITAKSEFNPIDTWKKFGPPAQRMRWCCSVHKTTPQIILLRQLLNNPEFKGVAFTGIRADESVARSSYDFISYGKKIKGQYSFHPVLEWNSAELFVYTYAHNLFINDAYKKGNSRAGCLVCPLAGYKNMFFKEQCYSCNDKGLPTTTMFNDIIMQTTSKRFSSAEAELQFMNIAGWKARRSGRELSIAENLFSDYDEGDSLKCVVGNESDAWKEWLKTISNYNIISDSEVSFDWEGFPYKMLVTRNNGSTTFIIPEIGNSKQEIQLKKALKIILKKTAYCIGCHVCEANCPHGYIHMQEGQVFIDNSCKKCRLCHEIDNGCLVANSHRLPKIDKKMGSINRYGNMGIEYDWIKQYFKTKDDFWSSAHSLGSNMIKNLKAFLSDSEITTKKGFSNFGSIIDEIGVDSPIAWGLILTNLAYSAEFNWWIKNIEFGNIYTAEDLKELLSEESDNVKTHIVSAFKNILISNTILANEIGLGVCDYYIKSGKRYLNSVTRKEWQSPDSRVILYALYKFAESCGNYYQFSLSRLLDDSVDSDGVSPTQIFGINQESMIGILKGLSINYPEYISVSFTHDLENISLREDKSSEEVLKLF